MRRVNKKLYRWLIPDSEDLYHLYSNKDGDFIEVYNQKEIAEVLRQRDKEYLRAIALLNFGSWDNDRSHYQNEKVYQQCKEHHERHLKFLEELKQISEKTKNVNNYLEDVKNIYVRSEDEIIANAINRKKLSNRLKRLIGGYINIGVYQIREYIKKVLSKFKVFKVYSPKGVQVCAPLLEIEIRRWWFSITLGVYSRDLYLLITKNAFWVRFFRHHKEFNF